MLRHFIRFSFLCAFVLTVICGCGQSNTATLTGDEDGGGGGSTGTPETVIGRVTDAAGKPISGARIRAQNDVFNSHAETLTDANGYYQLPKLKFGGWVIYAWYEVQYKDHTYQMRIGMPSPSDYGSFQPSPSGAVIKNFVWALKGNIPDRQRQDQNPFGYWGGMIHFNTYSALNDNMEYVPAGTKITVTLTPEVGAVQMDGTPGQTLTKTFTVRNNETNYYLYDVPQCSYHLKATAVLNGITHTISFGDRYSGPFTPELSDVYFMPSGGSGSYENGLSTVLSVTQGDSPINLKMNE